MKIEWVFVIAIGMVRIVILFLPQVTDVNTPRLMDAPGEYLL